MSVQSQITRIQEDRDIIRTKLNDFGLAELTATLDDCATAIDGIVNNGGVSEQVKEGESYTIPAGYHDGSGTVIGVAGGGNYNLQSKTVTPSKTQISVTADSGYYGLSDVVVTAIPAKYQDVTAVTATKDTVLTGSTYVSSTGAVIAGEMPDNGQVIRSLDSSTTSYTIAKGYHDGTGTVSVSTETKTITPKATDQTVNATTGKLLSGVTVKGVTVSLPSADKMLTTATASVTTNGTSLGSVTGSISSKAAATYYPKTTDQEIASGQYLSGKQTIKATTTSGITAANIKHGEVINVGYTGTGNEGKIATATGSFWNDGTTYTLNQVGTAIDMGASSSHRYITTDGLQVVPTATYTASGAITNADITTYGRLTIGSGTITENEGSVSTGTAPTFTQGTVSVSKAGWITTGTKVSGASFANTATSGTTYKDISATTAAPVLKSGDFLYINKGYTDNIKISLAKLVPDGGSASLTGDYILSGYSAYDNDGTLVAGSIPTVTTTVYHPSTTDQTVPSKNYTGSTGITIHGVTTANISAANIKSGVVVKVGDGDDDDRITSVTGTFTNESTNPITAATVLSGKIGWVNGAKVTGTMTNRGAKNYDFNALTQTSVTIEAGYHSGSGKVNLTADLENALAAI